MLTIASGSTGSEFVDVATEVALLLVGTREEAEEGLVEALEPRGGRKSPKLSGGTERPRVEPRPSMSREPSPHAIEATWG